MSKRALLIGINYKNSGEQLNGCINDVNNIRNVLVANMGYNQNNIRMLTDETSTLPTRANIEASISWLVSNCKAGDTLFFHYSGHGANIRDASGDETDGRDEVLVPLDFKTKGVISDDWILENLASKVPSGVTLWAFTDCCHSGSILDLKFNFRSNCTLRQGTISKGMPYVPSQWTDSYAFVVERSRDVTGTVVKFSGCLDAETSADATINRQPQGAFTHCLLEFVKANLSRQTNGTFILNRNVKLRNMLKELNARLDINGFTKQQTQLALSKQGDIDRVFSP